MRWLLIVVSSLVIGTSGCATTNFLSMFKNGDYADPTDGPDDPWVANAGMEARGTGPRELSEEPRWFREMVMSDRARAIESNLGIDD